MVQVGLQMEQNVSTNHFLQHLQVSLRIGRLLGDGARGRTAHSLNQEMGEKQEICKACSSPQIKGIGFNKKEALSRWPGASRKSRCYQMSSAAILLAIAGTLNTKKY